MPAIVLHIYLLSPVLAFLGIALEMKKCGSGYLCICVNL